MIFVGSSQSYATGDPTVRFFNDSKAFAKYPQPGAQEIKRIGPRGELVSLLTVQSFYCDEMLSNAEVMKEVSRADVVVGEFIYLCSSLVADKLSLPHVVLSASTLSTPTAFALGLPSPPSYVPQWNVPYTDEWSFVDRVRNVLQWSLLYVTYTYDMCPLYDKIKAKHNITPKKSIQETLGRVDMIISQVHFGLELPRPLYPSKDFVCKML